MKKHEKPDSIKHDQEIIARELNRLKIAADQYPQLDIKHKPQSRHWANFPGAVSVCFTRNIGDEGQWKYHLSISSSQGKVIDRVVQSILVHLNAPDIVKETPGVMDGGRVRHFWWPCDNGEIIN